MYLIFQESLASHSSAFSSISRSNSTLVSFVCEHFMDKVKSLLGREVRVLLSDGRVAEGELECLDKAMNLVLRNTKEFHNARESVQKERVGET